MTKLGQIQKSYQQFKQIPVSTNTNTEPSNINKIILNSAYNSILQSQPPKSQYNIPWWNKNLDNLRANENQTWRADFLSIPADFQFFGYINIVVAFPHPLGALRH